MKNMIMYKKGEHSWIRYIKMRIRSNLNFLALAEGSTGCLSKDTILKGQKKSLGDLYFSGNRFINTFSIVKEKGSWHPRKSKSEIIPSGIKEIYEIELEDGRKVLATGEHKFFITKNGKFTREVVSNLKEGDYLKTYPENYLEELGFEVIRFTDKDINKNWEETEQCIKQKLNL